MAYTLFCYCDLIFSTEPCNLLYPTRRTSNHSAAMSQSQPPAFNLTPLDHQLLAMKDEDFIAHSWDDLRDIIGESEMFLYFKDRYLFPLIGHSHSPHLQTPPSPLHNPPSPHQAKPLTDSTSTERSRRPQAQTFRFTPIPRLVG